MPRIKAFDRNIVVEQAMNLFWKKGYYATGVQELVDFLGISRSSMYDTFGDKEALFLESLHLYRNIYANKIMQLIQADESFIEILSHLFDFIIVDFNSHKEHKGCLMVNTAVESAAQEARIRVIVQTYFKDIEDALLVAIQKGIEKNQIINSKDKLASAQFILNTINGLHINAKVNNDLNFAKHVKELTLRLFKN